MKLFAVGVTFVCFFFTFLSVEACESLWTSHNDNSYRYFNSPNINWAEAETACVNEGAHLTSINNLAEDGIFGPWINSRGVIADGGVYTWSKYTHAVYIGLNDAKKNGVYEWTDATAVDYTNWTRNEPSEQKEESVTVMWEWPNNVGRWNDVFPDSRIGSYICEITTQIEEEGISGSSSEENSNHKGHHGHHRGHIHGTHRARIHGHHRARIHGHHSGSRGEGSSHDRDNHRGHPSSHYSGHGMSYGRRHRGSGYW